MKTVMMGLIAAVACSFAVPAFADDAPKADGDKMEKGAKKGHKKDKKDGEAAPAPAPSKM